MTAISLFEKAGFGKGPYRVIGYELKLHKDPGRPPRAGSTCDYCGTAIAHVYEIQSSDEVRFRVGCDCVRKVEPGLVSGCALVRRESVQAERRAAREARERDENGGKTRKELWEEERAKLAAAAAAERDAREARRMASVHVGTVGQREELTLTIVGWYDSENHYGSSRMYFFEDAVGNRFVWRTNGGIWQTGADGRPVKNARGQTFRLKGTIKAHSEYQGGRQTELTRVKNLDG